MHTGRSFETSYRAALGTADIVNTWLFKTSTRRAWNNRASSTERATWLMLFANDEIVHPARSALH